MGPEGLREVALTAHARTRALVEKLSAIPGASRVFSGASSHEAALKLPANADEVLRALRAQGILGGYPLARDYTELADAILVCATETKTDDDLADYARKLMRILGWQCKTPPCACEFRP